MNLHKIIHAFFFLEKSMKTDIIFKRYSFLLMLIIAGFSSNALQAHDLTGIVYGFENNEEFPLEGATVQWINTNHGTMTDEQGQFAIDFHAADEMSIVVSYIGYKTDTIKINQDDSFIEILLISDFTVLSEVKVNKARRSSFISSLEPIKTEVISKQELTKAACCDLSGCFETQASVDPQTTNILTNSKELRLLGLSGVYNQLLFEGIPMFQGPTYTYGISSYPGTLIASIKISKGANSVLQGYNGWAGQINVLPKTPENGEKLLINGYANSFGEKQLNINTTYSMGKKWKGLIAIHQVLPASKTDGDDDNFMDLPQINRTAIYNSYYFKGDKGLGLNFGYRLLREKRLGGQMNFTEDDKGTINAYGQDVKILQPEMFAKIGYDFSKKSALLIHTSAQYHDQESYFGTLAYTAKQSRFYINAQHTLLWGKDHSLKYGASFRYQDMKENILFPGGTLGRDYDGTYNTDQRIPGLYAENTFNWSHGLLVLIAGIRVDNHQEYGTFVTPRSILKYAPSKEHTLRVSAGTGWRQAHIFTEHLNLMASSRNVIFAEKLDAETGFNWGANYVYSFEMAKAEGNITVDFYQTLFGNQIFPDYDIDQSYAVIRNFYGKSVSNAFQLEANLNFQSGLEFKVGYNYLDVYRMNEGNKEELPFNAKHRVMASVSFRPKNSPWYFDVNGRVTGNQRLPNTSGNPEEYQRPDYSKTYFVLNGQITRLFGKFELYGGVENILNFRQLQPILAWDDPFGPYFDTSFVWGPTRGREFYLGFRYTIE